MHNSWLWRKKKRVNPGGETRPALLTKPRVNPPQARSHFSFMGVSSSYNPNPWHVGGNKSRDHSSEIVPLPPNPSYHHPPPHRDSHHQPNRALPHHHQLVQPLERRGHDDDEEEEEEEDNDTDMKGKELDDQFWSYLEVSIFHTWNKVSKEDLLDFLHQDSFLRQVYGKNLALLEHWLRTHQVSEGKRFSFHEFYETAKSLNQKTVPGREAAGGGDDAMVVVSDGGEAPGPVDDRQHGGVVDTLQDLKEQLMALYPEEYGPDALAGAVTHMQVAEVYRPQRRIEWSNDDAQTLREAEAQLEAMRLEREAAGGKDRRTIMMELEKRMVNKDATARERLAPLTNEQEAEVQRILARGRDDEILISRFNVDMKRKNIRCLLPRVWLDDEVINFYFKLLSERDERFAEEDKNHRKSHFFSSFFITKLLEDDKGYKYANVRRWAKSFDLFALDKVFCPVNLGNTHWCLAVIYIQEKKIQYFDSMGGPGTKYLEGLKQYLKDEYRAKKNEELDMSDWTLVPGSHNTPQQDNGVDCGVFVCATALLVSENLPLKMSQSDMANHRKKVALCIVKAKIL